MFLASADHAVLQYCHLIAHDCKEFKCVLGEHYPDYALTFSVLFSCHICICLLLFVAKKNSLKTNQDFFHFISDY